MVATRTRVSNLERVNPTGTDAGESDMDPRWNLPPQVPEDATSLMPPPAQQPDGAGPSRPPPSSTVRTRAELEEELRATQQELREFRRGQQSAGLRTDRQSGQSRQSRRSPDTVDTARSRTPSQHNREESATHTPSDIPTRTPRRARPDTQIPPATQTPPEFQYRRTTVTDFKTFMSCKPAEFTGGHDPVKCARWLREMELCFETCQCDEHMRVIYAARMFRGAALDWWDTTREAMGSATVAELSWIEFKGRVKTGFCTELDLEKLEEDFRSLSMGNRTVTEYTKSFMEKLRFVGHLFPSEAEKVNRYCKGLLPKYRGMCRHMSTLDAAILEARRLEEDSKAEKAEIKTVVGDKRKDFRSSGFEKESHELRDRKKFNTGEKKDASSSRKFCEVCKSWHSGECKDDTRRCLHCGRVGHQAKDCRSEVKCFNCQKFGHISTSCPEPRKERKDKTKSQVE